MKRSGLNTTSLSFRYSLKGALLPVNISDKRVIALHRCGHGQVQEEGISIKDLVQYLLKGPMILLRIGWHLNSAGRGVPCFPQAMIHHPRHIQKEPSCCRFLGGAYQVLFSTKTDQKNKRAFPGCKIIDLPDSSLTA